MDRFTLAHLIALGPVPRRFIRSVDELVQLAAETDPESSHDGEPDDDVAIR